ncbi:MAG: DNRLRE domain-containing protein [Chitinophagaceae bacterium]
MKNFTTSPGAIIFFLSFHLTVSAQSYTSYTGMSTVLKADTNTHSALVSNLFEDRAGDQSPVLGTAGWSDKGKHFQCRSLLIFNYGALPAIIKPEHIISADLILNPVQLDGSVMNEEKNSTFIVRRILQPWEDSLTSWANQPLANYGDEVVKIIKPNKKDRTVKIDVTRLVKDMFRFGNNGFLICNGDSLEKTGTFSQWFASARNEDYNIRPSLVIYYEVAYKPVAPNDKIPPLPLTARDKQELMDMYFRKEPVTTTAPVVPPPTPIKE